MPSECGKRFSSIFMLLSHKKIAKYECFNNRQSNRFFRTIHKDQQLKDNNVFRKGHFIKYFLIVCTTVSGKKL